MIKVCYYVDYIQSVFQKKEKCQAFRANIWHTGT